MAASVRFDSPWTDWSHVTKLDPDKSLPTGVTYADVCATGTDAILVGGTTGVTDDAAEGIISACRDHGLPVYQEPNDPSVVVSTGGIDGYLVPSVLNAGDPFWVVGAHKEGIRLYPDHPWEHTDVEAYVVLNPASSVATYTEADCDLTTEDVVAYAGVAERFYSLPIVYLEYSGMFGDPALVRAATDAVSEASVFYGGGIDGYDAARTMAAEADVVVVGNAVYEDGIDALSRTVAGVRDAAAE